MAAEPLIESPIVMDFDADGRLWVLELKAFMPDDRLPPRNLPDPINNLVVLEDTDNDGKMDKRTVFADGLVMPRALKVLEHGVLVGEPPNLWLMKDTNGDLKMDTKEKIVDTYGTAGTGIEHKANSTFWALDNIMYSSEHTFNLRYKNGKFESLPTLSRGQWQVSQDDAGRIYRNVNDSPLFVDYTPAAYFLRNPNVARTRGLYDLVIEQMDATVYPVRPNRGVNRGYRDPLFRKDGSAIVIMGTSGPAIYRGDKYPANIRGAALISDSPTNLVHAMTIIDDGTGKLTAKNTFPRGEFLASSDERFRPAMAYSGPDGNMYVVDVYRGVVQDAGIWSDYLRDYIVPRGLQLPVGRGRIWRVVYGTGPNTRGPKPSLSTATPAQLVQTLSHANGWWRDNAQRILVERGDKSVVPALTQAAATAPDWRTRLHALWTLDGMDAIEPAMVEKALVDLNPDVRAAGVRISERWLGQPNAPIAASVLKLVDDKTFTVRRQVAASIGALPEAARMQPAVAILTKDGTDEIIVDTAISSLKGIEGDVLNAVLQARAATKPPAAALEMLAAAVVKGGDQTSAPIAVQRYLDIAADTTRPAWARLAVLEGVDDALPGGGGGRGGGGGVGLAGLSAPGGRVAVSPRQTTVSLAAEPQALVKLSAGTGDLAMTAKSVWNKLNWPGRQPVVIVTPLTPEQQKRYVAGEKIYKDLCMGCHGEDGRGKDKLGANLVDSQYVNGADVSAPIRIVLHGKEGSIGLMVPLGTTFNDEQIASALTYVRRAWGHTASPVDPLSVMELRGTNKARNKPWTDAELQAGGGGGRGGGGANRGGGAGNRGGGAAAPGGNAPAGQPAGRQ